MRCVRSPAHLRPRTRAHKLAFTPRIVIETNSKLAFTPRIVIETNSKLSIHPNHRNAWTYTQFI